MSKVNDIQTVTSYRDIAGVLHSTELKAKQANIFLLQKEIRNKKILLVKTFIDSTLFKERRRGDSPEYYSAKSSIYKALDKFPEELYILLEDFCKLLDEEENLI